ncbi:hypothetical protein [Oceanihabitans sediminis]|uniref:hypothetical protein n=1 Tax=Oceanihabitans sediminis TaxID=1812012 RepID=UPI003A9130D7
MSNVERSFQRLKKRPISNDERLIIHELKDTYGIDEDDPIWSIIFAFGYHLELYKKIPGQINAQRQKTVEETQRQAEEIARATAEGVSKAQMSQIDKKINRAIKKASTGLSAGERVFYSILSSVAFMSCGAVIMLLVILYNPDVLPSIIELMRGAGK